MSATSTRKTFGKRFPGCHTALRFNVGNEPGWGNIRRTRTKKRGLKGSRVNTSPGRQRTNSWGLPRRRHLNGDNGERGGTMKRVRTRRAKGEISLRTAASSTEARLFVHTASPLRGGDSDETAGRGPGGPGGPRQKRRCKSGENLISRDKSLNVP